MSLIPGGYPPNKHLSASSKRAKRNTDRKKNFFSTSHPTQEAGISHAVLTLNKPCVSY